MATMNFAIRDRYLSLGKATGVYVLRVGIALDQLANAVLGGYPNETISARSWRKEAVENRPIWKVARFIIDGMFFFQEDHCKNVYEYSKIPWKECGVYMPISCANCPKLNNKTGEIT